MPRQHSAHKGRGRRLEPAAEEGTFAHEVASTCLLTGKSARDKIGHTDIIHTVDGEMADYLQEYLDIVHEVALGSQWLMVEQKVALVGVRDDIHGTGDAITLSNNGRRLDVLDLKFGAGVWVDVKKNPQLRTYGIASILTHGRQMPNVEEIGLHVIQPRHHAGGHTTEVLSFGELQDWLHQELVPAAERTEQLDAPLAAGEWCVFCPAKAFCPELKRASMERTVHLFEDETMAVPAKAPPPPNTMTLDELGVALNAFGVIEQWMKAVRATAYAAADNGKTVPGHKLVAKSTHRKWVSEAAAKLGLSVLLPDDVPLFAEPKLISPAQAEKRVPKPLRDIISKLTTKPAGGTVLVPTSDPKPAINRAAVFDDLPVKSEPES